MQKPSIRKKILAVSLTILAGIIISACAYDDDLAFRINPEFALPLLTGSLNIEDILPDEDLDNMEIDEDGLVTIVARSSTSTQNADELILLTDQHFPFQLPLLLNPGAKMNNKTDTVIELQYVAGFNFGLGEKLDSLKFSSGTLELLVSEPQMTADGYDVTFDVSIPNIFDENGNPLTTNFDLNEKVEINLGSSVFVFYHTEDSFNNIDIEFSITISGNGATQPYELLFEQNFIGLNFFGIYGDITAFDFETPGDTIKVSLFEKWEEGMISFSDPSLILKADNSFGFTTNVYYETLRAVNNNDFVDMVAYPPVSITPWVINNAQNPGQPAQSTLILDRETSNLDDFINLPPKEVIYAVQTELLSHQTALGFIKHDSKIDLDLEFRLPLHGSISNYVLNETFEISPGDISDNIEKLELHTTIINTFPIDARFQLTFLDQNQNILFLLFDEEENQNIIAAALVNEDGEVVEETKKESVIRLTPEKIEKLKDSKELTARVKLQTAEEGEIPIKIYTHQTIDIKIVLQGQLSIDL